jgi:hypothetical protein
VGIEEKIKKSKTDRGVNSARLSRHWVHEAIIEEWPWHGRILSCSKQLDYQFGWVPFFSVLAGGSATEPIHPLPGLRRKMRLYCGGDEASLFLTK